MSGFDPVGGAPVGAIGSASGPAAASLQVSEQSAAISIFQSGLVLSEQSAAISIFQPGAVITEQSVAIALFYDPHPPPAGFRRRAYVLM